MGKLVLFLFGGMLVNYLADVFPYQRKIARPKCLNCGAVFGIWENLLYHKPCTECGQKRSLRNYVVLGISLVLAIWLHFMPPDSVSFFWAFLVFSYLGLIVVIDIEHKLILHITSYTGLIIGILFGAQFQGLGNALLGGAAGYLIMLLFYLLGGVFVKFISKTRGESIDEIPLGFGDVNLAGIIGLFMGFPGILTGLIIAVFSAGGFSLILFLTALIRGQSTTNLVIPYGPFLTLGLWIAILI